MIIVFGRVRSIDENMYTYEVETPDSIVRVSANLELKVKPGDTVMVLGIYAGKEDDVLNITEDEVFKIDESLVNIGHKIFRKSDEIYLALRNAQKEREGKETEKVIDELLEDDEKEPVEIDFEEGDEDA